MLNTNSTDIFTLLRKLKKHVLLIISLSILVGVLCFVISKFYITPTYLSNTTMIVGNLNQENNQDAQESNIDINQIQANKALVLTYSEIVKSRGIFEKVKENLDLDMDYEDFSKKVSIEAVNDTQIISVKVVDTIPERSTDIANETSLIFKDSISKIMNVDNVHILDKAILPEEPISPNINRNTIIGIILGFILGLIISLIKEVTDTTIKSGEEISEVLDIPCLGIIPDKNK